MVAMTVVVVYYSRIRRSRETKDSDEEGEVGFQAKKGVVDGWPGTRCTPGGGASVDTSVAALTV